MVVVDYSTRSLHEINEITEYLGRYSPAYAKSFVDAVFEKIDLLKRFPQLGRVVPEVGDAALRELLFKQYRIFYKIYSPSNLPILSVQSGSQLPQDIR